MQKTVSLTVNGKPVSATVEGRTLLVQLLREQLGLTGTHVGCDTSQCGACVVHVDGEHRMRRLGHRRAVLRMDLPPARQTADAVGRHLRAYVDGDNPWGRACGRRVDRGDPRMRVRAA